jgi:hypothetical protein
MSKKSFIPLFPVETPVGRPETPVCQYNYLQALSSPAARPAQKKSSLIIDPTQDKITILALFWPNMTIFGQIVDLIRILDKDDLTSLF